MNRGTNYFNIVWKWDGSVNDAVGMTIYDNTADQIKNATDDSQLNILFTSKNLRGQHISVATCPAWWTLDTSAWRGGYVCKQVDIIALDPACRFGSGAIYNGSCGTAADTCNVWTPANSNYAMSCGTSRTWDCQWYNGGTTASCSYQNGYFGQCVDYPWDYTVSQPATNTADWCLGGTYLDTADSAYYWEWQCVGWNSAQTVNCIAANGNQPPPTCNNPWC